MSGEDIPGRRQSKCKGPEVREGMGCWRNSKRSAVAGGRERGREAENESREGVGANCAWPGGPW